MSLIRVALLQMAGCGNDQEKHLIKGLDFCRRAKAAGADLALFPEMWNIGYVGFDKEDAGARDAWRARAVARDSDYVQQFRELARELEMAIAVTYLEAREDLPANVVTLIDRRGELLMTYAKVHTCDFGPMEACCVPGDDFYVCELDTGKAQVQVGAMICYDREAPESARVLMLKGAELVLTPNACGLDDLRIDQYKTRAYENAVGMAMTNYATPSQNGHSVAFGADGALLVAAGGAEGIYPATFDLDQIREYRSKTIWGNAFRRPHRYGLLTAADVTQPFARNNAFGRPFDRTAR